MFGTHLLDDFKFAIRARSRDGIRRARDLALAKLRLLSIAALSGGFARGLRRWRL